MPHPIELKYVLLTKHIVPELHSNIITFGDHPTAEADGEANPDDEDWGGNDSPFDSDADD